MNSKGSELFVIRFRQVSFQYSLYPSTNRAQEAGATEERSSIASEAAVIPTASFIQSLSLSINQGEYVAIVGPNGCGKSTLAKLMNGILLPTQGEVVVDGKSTTDEQALHHIRQKVGLVFQNPENQMVATTVFDDVAFGLENIGFPPEQMYDHIHEVLHRVGMWEYRDTEPHHLSGGQKQRVAIAGILAMRPDAIIFDEATSMLDPQGRKDVLTIMNELNRDGLTVIHITHDMDEAAEASRVLVMKNGQLLKDMPQTRIFKDAEWLTELHLELPFIDEAIAKLKQYGVSIPGSIHSQKELVSYLWTLSSKI